MDIKNDQSSQQSQIEELKDDILRHLRRQVGVSEENASPRDWLLACSFAVRSLLVERWHTSNEQRRRAKQVGYFSMEFLLSRQLENALLTLDLRDEFAAALEQFGVALSDIFNLEPEPALGNGGLGRLAACFLDSLASIGVPAYGYGLYYEYGMFRQNFSDGWQTEQPEEWLSGVNPWDFMRSDPEIEIGFGGHVEHHNHRAIWNPDERIIATAHDLLVPGKDSGSVNTLRLWSARPIHGFDIATFNRGRHLEALAPKIRSKTLSRLLYPDDSTEEGRELRLRQEYFFSAASVQDMLSRYIKEFGPDMDQLPDKVAIHLNDTHPALAPVELMRQLVDVHELGWDRAWSLTNAVISYTNHTLMPEALEAWRADLMGRVVPRHLQIIEEINRRLVTSVSSGTSSVLPDRVSLVSSDQTPIINMGRLSAHASHRVNGVSALHSELVKDKLFPEFATLHPERFINVTNGISQRLWLYQSNPDLADLIDKKIGPNWRKQFDPTEFGQFSGDSETAAAVADIKLRNKKNAAAMIEKISNVAVDPTAMFDIQIKRIHEYKRQLLNILGVISLWNDIKDTPASSRAPRVVLMAGKAASSYWLAKLIIKLANDVARRINGDRETRDKLTFHFLPNYNVSMAQWLIPAADLSQQISLAGTEASGTGNMKLAVNGALTLGTRDGANIEIAEAVGEANTFMFGLTVSEVEELRTKYSPLGVYQSNGQLKHVLEQIGTGVFSPEEPERFRPILDALLGHGDRYMVLADFSDYLRAQKNVDELWATPDKWQATAIKNISAMGRFSSDRAIREYANSIWHVDA